MTGATLVLSGAEPGRNNVWFMDVTNDDAPQGVTVGFTQLYTTAVEGNAGSQVISVPVQLSAASSEPVTVEYTTSNWDATEGVDYSAPSGPLIFAPGQTSATIPITIYGDTAYEGDERIVVNVTQVTGATLVLSGAEPGRNNVWFMDVTNDDAP